MTRNLRSFYLPAILMAMLSSGKAATTVYNFNASGQGWTASSILPMEGPFVYGNTGVGASGAWSSIGQIVDSAQSNTTFVTSPSILVQSTGTVTLSFDHLYSFEGGAWDGGVVQFSVNGGGFTTIPFESFSANPYVAVITGWGAGGENSQSALAGMTAFAGDSPGRSEYTFITSVANVGSFNPGDALTIRFMSSSDTNTSGAFSPQWVIDNVSVTNTVPEPGSLGLAALAGVGLLRRRTRQ